MSAFQTVIFFLCHATENKSSSEKAHAHHSIAIDDLKGGITKKKE